MSQGKKKKGQKRKRKREPKRLPIRHGSKKTFVKNVGLEIPSMYCGSNPSGWDVERHPLLLHV